MPDVRTILVLQVRSDVIRTVLQGGIVPPCIAKDRDQRSNERYPADVEVRKTGWYIVCRNQRVAARSRQRFD